MISPAPADGVLATVLPPWVIVIAEVVIVAVALPWRMSTICAVPVPTPPSLSVAVAVATSTPTGIGVLKEKFGPAAVAITTPFWVSVQATVSVSRIPGSVATAVRLIVLDPTLPALSIRTAGGALLTTMNVSAEVVLTSSDTETWMS